MSDSEEETYVGPVMVVSTEVLRKQRARIGRITKDLVLPRTITIVSLVGIVVGAVLGLGLGFIVGGGNLTAVMLGGSFFGAIGWAVVNFQPWKGESVSTYVRLTAKGMKGRSKVDGKIVKIAIGTCYISETAAGQVTMRRGAIPIAVGQHDDRGVLITKKNRNTTEDMAKFEARIAKREAKLEESAKKASVKSVVKIDKETQKRSLGSKNAAAEWVPYSERKPLTSGAPTLDKDRTSPPPKKAPAPVSGPRSLHDDEPAKASRWTKIAPKAQEDSKPVPMPKVVKAEKPEKAVKVDTKPKPLPKPRKLPK